MLYKTSFLLKNYCFIRKSLYVYKTEQRFKIQVLFTN